jgi:peptide/nickel transport system substrate-binding protein
MTHHRACSRRAFLAALGTSGLSHALGRTPYGGRLRLGLPWPITGLDPSSLGDGFSALFAGAVFDPLFGLDAAGHPYPTLADGLPAKLDAGSKVSLRPGLKSGGGRPLGAADIVSSVARARARGAAGVLGEIDSPRPVPGDALSVVFPQSAPDQVARALASPLVPLVPRGFSPLTPDGTGAFRVELGRGRATFTRNPQAARGTAFLDTIEVTAVSDLAELLRGFESGASDVGWFGTGLYRAAKDAVAFEAPRYGFAVLLSGKQAGAWGAPGALQPLLDAVPAQQLTHLGLRALPAQAQGTARWGGPTAQIAVLASAPQLVAVARSLSAALSTPGHELTVAEKSAEELSALRDTRQFGLMLDLVRAGPTPREVELALRTAASPEAAKRAPKTASLPPRELGRQLALGVVGELSVYGARRASLVGLEGWQLGAVWARPGT